MEGAVAKFEGDAARREAVATQVGHGAIGEAEEDGAQHLEVVGVDSERGLAADRLGQRAAGGDRRETAPEGELTQPVRAAPERRRKDGERHVLEHAHGGEAESGETLLGDRADAVQGADRQLAQAAADVGFAELADARRFVETGRDLGKQLRGPDADRAGEAVFGVHPLLDAAGDRARRAEQAAAAGDVEVRLVDRRHLDLVGEAAQQIDEAVVHNAVGREVGHQERALRAEPLGLADRHGRAHAAGARLVRAGGDDAATATRPADDDGQAAQLGAPRLLDRGEEGVHVDVEDGPVRYEHTFV